MIYNQEHDGSCILEGFYFTVSYAPVAGILSLCIIIEVESSEGLIIFVLDISNGFQNILFPNPAVRVYQILTDIYLD